MKLILVRHGETEENKKGILQGHLHGTLSKEGIGQVKKLALRLKDERIDVIYSSDLKRASDTAKEIAKFHPGVELFLVKELREKDQGCLTGKLVSEVDWSKPRDTEKKEAMHKRAKAILDEVYGKYKNQTVLFVSHGGLIKVLISILTNNSLEDLKKMENLSNTSLSIFEIKGDNNHKVIVVNCNKHLLEN